MNSPSAKKPNLSLVRPAPEARGRAIEDVIAQARKAFGDGSLMRLGERPQTGIPVTPSGSLALDRALGIGGIPKGRITEIFGHEGSGKTTLGLLMIAEAQKQGEACAFIDMEHALSPEYARALGVNVDDLLISQPESGEQALELAEMLVRSCAIGMIAIDSVAALVPRAELEGEMTDASIGLQARLMSQGLRKLAGIISRSGTTVVFMNQVRQKIGVTFDNGEVTPGGMALKFYASVRLDVRRQEAIRRGDDAIGHRIKVRVVKNKMAPPHRAAEFDLNYGIGISHEGELLDLGVATGIVEKAGSWYSYRDRPLGQGREAARQTLAADTARAAALAADIRATFTAAPELGETAA